MHILALNPGSSTLKYRLFDVTGPGDEKVLAEGIVEHVAGKTTARAAEEAIRRCLPKGVEALCYRIVQGGPRLIEPTRVTPEVIDLLRGVADLAPLHNEIAIAVMEAGSRLAPDVPGVAIFDTAFHSTMPEIAARYALPTALADKFSLRRYGFHGISHHYVSQRAIHLLGRGPAGTRIITCHLGNGASICAVRDGRSVDTSMGLTPLEGLVMGTRSGDVDPGLVLYLLKSANMTAQQVDDLLNRQSGLLGISGKSGDVRELQAAAAKGDPASELALSMFAYRARKYIGAYAAALGGVDGIVFTGGIGEHSANVRERICRDMEFLGIELDQKRNESADGRGDDRISRDHGRVQLWVIPTDEEKQMVRETLEFLSKQPGS
jgi:acetate kinase